MTSVGALRCGRDGARGARRHDRRASTRSTATRSRNDVLAARRALDVAGVGLVNPIRRCDGTDGRGDVTRHTTAATAARRARVPTKRSVRARQGWRRSVSRTTRSRPALARRRRRRLRRNRAGDATRRVTKAGRGGRQRRLVRTTASCWVVFRDRRICLRGYCVSARMADDRNGGSLAARRLLRADARERVGATTSRSSDRGCGEQKVADETVDGASGPPRR